MRIIQSTLLSLYRGFRRTGFLTSRPGRALFERAYWAYKSWIEARDLHNLQSHIVPASTVIDVGANIGFFTVSFARWLKPAGHVISIEPEAANFASLRDRIERLGFSKIVTPVNAAAVEVEGTVCLAINPDHPADHRVADHGILVRAVSIDILLAERGWPKVSLIKIDVQGSELRVIRGAKETLHRFHPVLFVEFDEPSLTQAGSSSAELLGELQAFGYAPYALNPNGSLIPINEGAIHHRMVTRGYLDVLLLHHTRRNNA